MGLFGKKRIEGRTAEEWFELGYKAKDLEKEVEYYTKGLELDPDNAVAWYAKGIALDELERYEEAIRCYDKVLEINPKYEKAKEAKRIAEEKLREEQVRRVQIIPPETVTPKPIPTPMPVSHLSIERRIYDPTKGFITSKRGIELPNVKRWIEEHDASMYWFIVCIRNDSDRLIDVWNVEIEADSLLELPEVRADCGY